MKQYQTKIPSSVICGEGCIESLREIIEKEKAKNVAVFTDRGVSGAGLSKPLLHLLDGMGVAYRLIDDLVPEPCYADVERAVEQMPEAGDLVVAIGGGSVMDTAKLCTVLYGVGYSIKDLLKDSSIARKQVKSVMVPTTCGTGSEATCNAIVLVPEDSVKVGIVSDLMIPDYVLLDPDVILKLPSAIVAATGVDALAHAVECYTSNKANPFSDVYALASARLIFQNIRRAYDNPADIQAKTNMLIGAFYGGAAITSSGTTAVHALSYPLGGKFHIPHGVSNAILFAHIMSFNMDTCTERLANICDAVFPEKSGETTQVKAKLIVDEIADIVRHTQIPASLDSFGVKLDDIDFLVDAASKVTRLLSNNCKALSLEDIREIYKKVL